MTTLEELKKALGPAVNLYSDIELEQLLALFEKIADRVFDHWLMQRNVDKVN